MNTPPRVVSEDNIAEFLAEKVAPSGSGSHDPSMDAAWKSSVDTQLGELKGAVDGLRSSFTILSGAIGLVAAVMAIGFAFFGVQFNRLDAKIDTIPPRLSEEFRAMRAEMAAQTSAIANSITATKQAQPQIFVLPEPQPAPTQQPHSPQIVPSPRQSPRP